MIGVKQYDLIYKKHYLELLKLGFQPTFNDVVQRAGKDLPSITDVDIPLYKYRPQGRGQIFDTVLYNKSIDNISMDLDLLFEEVEDLTKNNIRRVIHSDLFHSVHSSELSRMSYQLDALLFETSGADENFFVQFENFSTTAKVDSEASDAAIVNTAEGMLSLPMGLKGALKLDMSHLESVTVPIDTEIFGENPVNEGNIPGTTFSNVIKDSTFPWGMIVTSKSNVETSVSFTVRLKHEEFVNRITLLHHGEKAQTATIETSIDKQNIKSLKDYSDGVTLKNQSKVVSLDFDDTLVDYLHITLSKTEADSAEELKDGSSIFKYMFGLKNISIYTTGRKEKAVYQSLPFDFSDSVDAIGRVALTAKTSIPEDTSIDWEIAGVSDLGVTSQFLTITPDNYPSDTGPPTVRVLQDIFSDKIDITTDPGTTSSVDSANSIDFYQLGSVPTKPLFGSGRLYRGNRSWLRDNSKSVNPSLIKDNFITFDKGDTQSVYSISTESVNPVTSNLNGVASAAIVLSKSPLYNPLKGHFVIPQDDINPEIDTQPNYAIYSISYNADPTLDVVASFNFSEGQGEIDIGLPLTIDTGHKLIKYTGTSSVRLEDTAGTKVYIDGVDYFIVLDEAGFPTGQITGIHEDLVIPEGTTYLQVILTYKRDLELTRFVETISGQQVYLNVGVAELNSSTALIVRYRHKTEDILKASVKAKSAFGIIAGPVYTQGVDYIFDSINGTIQRLTTGNIPPGSNIYLDYKFNDTSEQLEQFFAWVFFNENTGEDKTIIKTSVQDTGFLSSESTLTPDTEKKEEFFVSVPKLGLVNLTNAIEWPAMSGWVQFIIKSTNPDLFENALVNQIIKLRDLEGEFIFVEGGKYFSTLTAIRDSLTHVSYPLLKYNTLKKDHTRFAVREVIGGTTSYQLVVNFEPNTDPLLYRYAPASSPETEGNDDIEEVSEKWSFHWSSPQTSDVSVSKIVVRAKLNRDSSSAQNVTPKIDDFFIKVGL